MRTPYIATGLLGLAAIAFHGVAAAGVTNPDISVIGQPLMMLTDDAADPDANRARLDVGETEFVFDAYLNPSARGSIVLALAEEGMELEEGYFTLLRGLPGGLGLKGGKYRAGFGKLNIVHPHAYPFAERFHVLASYLPGEESLNENGLSVSALLPTPETFSLTAAADWFQGNSFRVPRETTGDPADPLETGEGDREELTRPAFLGRLSSFAMLGDRSGLEVGLSATGGTNNVAAKARTKVFGADVKAKLWNSERSYLVLQGEILRLEQDQAAWSAAGGYTSEEITAAGGYFFAEYQMDLRRNVGASYERFQEPVPGKPSSQALGLFAGYAIMEETTVFRLAWERFDPAGGEATNTYTLRVIYSMGPHKAHQF